MTKRGSVGRREMYSVLHRVCYVHRVAIKLYILYFSKIIKYIFLSQ